MDLLRRLGCGAGLGMIMLVLALRLDPAAWARWRNADLRQTLGESFALMRQHVSGAAEHPATAPALAIPETGPVESSAQPAPPSPLPPAAPRFPVVPVAVVGGLLLGFCAPGRKPLTRVTLPRQD